MWDVQPFASGSRLVRIFRGAQHNFEKNLIKLAWTADGKHVGCGSADRNVYVWNAFTGRVEYALPGHKVGSCLYSYPGIRQVPMPSVGGCFRRLPVSSACVH